MISARHTTNRQSFKVNLILLFSIGLDGNHALLVGEDGAVYFTGTPKVLICFLVQFKRELFGLVCLGIQSPRLKTEKG